MKPGRELDALVAEKVMGWTLVADPRADGQPMWVDADKNAKWPAEPPDRWGKGIWRPSTDIAAAWELVEALGRKFFGFALTRSEHGLYRAEFSMRGVETDFRAPAVTAPLAICLAALRAVGHQVPA